MKAKIIKFGINETIEEAEVECRCDKEHYIAQDGQELLLFQDPITRKLRGCSLEEAEAISKKFIKDVSTEITRCVEGLRSGESLFKEIATRLYCIFSEHTPEYPWLSLPADTRSGRNKSTLADHALLTSAISVSLLIELLESGCEPKAIAGFEIDRDSLIHLTRIAALCHDLGKHPPSNHAERGAESVKQLLEGNLSQEHLEAVANVAKRHHSSRSYREKGLEPISKLEQIVCIADTASGADRATELDQCDKSKPFDEIAAMKTQQGYSKYPVNAEIIHTIYSGTNRIVEGLFEDKEPIALILTDADRIKDYVYESAKLPEVRGASEILDRLNREKLKEMLFSDFQLPAECLIYAAGGGAVIIAPAAKSQDICNRIHSLYLEKSKVATTTAVCHKFSLLELQCGLNPLELWFDKLSPCYENANADVKKVIENYYGISVPLETDAQTVLFDSFLRSKCFGELTKFLGYKLKKSKESKSTGPLFEVIPYARRCDSCEIRPATKSGDTEFERERFHCEVCHCKRSIGRNTRRRRSKEFVDFLEGSQHEAAVNYKRKMEDCFGGSDNVTLASSLDALAKAADNKNAQNCIGLITMDGNDIGTRLERVTTPAEYRHFANELYEAIQNAVFESLVEVIKSPKRVFGEEGEEKIHPFEIIVIGGDDLFLFVPADKAIEIAIKIAKKFESAFQCEDGKPELTISGGVLISHVHNPIYYTHTVVEGLLKRAKKFAKKANCSMIDFLVITGDSDVGDDVNDYFETRYRGRFQDKEWLAERPYTPPDLEKLLQVARELQRESFPKSQLYAIAQSLSEKGMAISKNFFRYQLARNSELSRLKKIFTEEGWKDTAPWKPMGNAQFSTPIIDLMELYDFVGT